MKHVYQCENCKGVHKTKSSIYTCFVCSKEICEHCLCIWGTCKECAATKTDDELRILFCKFAD